METTTGNASRALGVLALAVGSVLWIRGKSRILATLIIADGTSLITAKKGIVPRFATRLALLSGGSPQAQEIRS